MKRLTIFSFLVLVASGVLFGMTMYQRVLATDTKGPKISIESDDITVSISDPESALTSGVTANDARDGDVTDTLVVESVSSFLDNTDHQRLITYAAFDNSGNVTKATRKMQYSDYTAIKLSLGAPLRFAASSNGNTNILGSFSAWDCLEGDITEKLNMNAGDDLAYDIAGDYDITVTVSNTMGDHESYPMTVTIYDQTAASLQPQINLTDYLVYTAPGTKLNAEDYLDNITIRGSKYKLTSEAGTYGIDTSEMEKEEREAFNKRDPEISYDYITIDDSNVDYNTPGTYEIKYIARDAEDNIGTVRLIVVVEEV